MNKTRLLQLATVCCFYGLATSCTNTYIKNTNDFHLVPTETATYPVIVVKSNKQRTILAISPNDHPASWNEEIFDSLKKLLAESKKINLLNLKNDLLTVSASELPSLPLEVDIDILLFLETKSINLKQQSNNCFSNANINLSTFVFSQPEHDLILEIPLQTKFNSTDECFTEKQLIASLTPEIATHISNRINILFTKRDKIVSHWQDGKIALFKAEISPDHPYHRGANVSIYRQLEIEKYKPQPKKIASGIVTNLISNEAIFIMVDIKEAAKVKLGDFIVID